MKDSLAMLAIAVNAQPGVYALLLGSGLSSAAGVPTGHGVTLDLIRKIATVRGVSPGEDPEKWFVETFRDQPRYSTLLEQLAPTQTDRRALLKEYFEPSPEDVEAGLKVPTVAHKAIARLVSRGQIRVILTTNFDRLIEQSLADEGVRPIVVSTTDQIKGMTPLVHNECTLIKLHGDYLDVRIRNTESELATYEPSMDSLLDRVLDEYGLIVVGWSSSWDTALRVALERAPTRRYATYWAHRSNLDAEATRLINHRQAVPIEIVDADDFFDQLEKGLGALAYGGSARSVITPQAAIAQLKRDLDDPSRRIALADSVREEAAQLREAIGDETFEIADPQVSPPTPQTYEERLMAYEGLSERLMGIVATGCAWSRPEQMGVFEDALRIVADPTGWNLSGFSYWIALRLAPALMVFYAGGIAALANERVDNYVALALTRLVEGEGKERPAAAVLRADSIIAADVSGRMPSQRADRLYTPTTEFLFVRLREALRDLVRTDLSYERSFDMFEYLTALISQDLGQYPHFGRFAWKSRWPGQWTPSQVVADDLVVMQSDWPPIASGAFGRDVARALEAKEAVDNAVSRFGWY